MEQIIEQVRQITPELIDQTIGYYSVIFKIWSIATTCLLVASIVAGIIVMERKWGGDAIAGAAIMVVGGLFSFIGMAVSFSELYRLTTAPYLYVFEVLTR